MYAFPTFVRSFEKRNQELLDENWHTPDKVKQFGIIAGSGSAIFFPLDIQGYPLYTHNYREPIAKSLPFLNHVVCGRLGRVAAGAAIINRCYCKVGDFSVVNITATSSYLDWQNMGNICVQGKDFCDVTIRASYVDRPICPDIGIAGGQFTMVLDLSRSFPYLELQAVDMPVTLYLNGEELPVKVTPEMGKVHLRLSMESGRYSTLSQLRQLQRTAKRKENSDETRIKA